MIKNNKWFKIVILYYLPAFLWMGLIFYLSSIPGLRTGVESVSLEIFFRKVAHISEYLILSFLVWRIFKDIWRLNSSKAQLATLIFCFSFALSDEIHQNFVENRAGRMVDVFVDLAGISAGIILGEYLVKIKKRK